MSSIHADPPPPIVTEPTGINYATGSALGKGGFAICHRAERYDGSKPTGHLVALKIVKTKMEPAKLAQKFVSELQIHSKLAHPNIVAFYRAFAFQTSTYVVLELCPNGSLADMLKKRKHLTLPEIRRFVIQICGAVKYLHHRHIVHRDLKTGNLFLDAGMNVKVGDFGLAALLVTEREMEVKRRTTMCGTPNYLAPEILEKGKGHDEKVDLWAIGVIAFTLAVGKAPFHATTKEEIYKKLKSGTYAWPELSATTHQSADLRDLVASLLVPEEQRPPPDQIVSQSFFKIAFVPSSIPYSAREKAPVWTEVAVPSAETIRKGYSDTWFALCKQSGVGEYLEGQCFPLNRGRKVKSIVYDMTREAQAGKTPTMPIPKDIVYISTVSNWDVSPNASLTESCEEVRRPPSRGLREIAHNEVASTRPVVAERRAARDAELMPPPALPRPAGRTGTVRKAARTISEETAKSADAVRIANDEPPVPTLRVSKTRPLPSTATLKESNAPTPSLTSSRATKPHLPTTESDTDRPIRSNTAVKRGADASLARRPRPAANTAVRKERPLSPTNDISGPLGSMDALSRVSPIKRSRKKVAEAEVIEILSDPEELAVVVEQPVVLSLPPPPVMSRRLPVPRQPSSTSADPSALPGTDPETVLARLTELHSNLTLALANRNPPSSSTTHRQPAEEPAESLPFVSRWVDYSRKHGVGYVLADGTVGVIIHASRKNHTPLAHVIVRNGQKWLPRVGKNFERIDSVPIEILEDCGERGIVRKVYKGLGSVREGPLKDEAERRRTLSVLWVKFGRYMCQSLFEGEQEEQSSGKGDGNFVRFYQRVGGVGIWGFLDGGLQVHFPDHTKLVLSASGALVSATLISSEAATHLAQHGDLLPVHVSSREVFADSTFALLYEGGRVRQRTVKANAVREKLAFVQEVVGQWMQCGGLGKLRDGDGLSWSGPVAGEGKGREDRVTVGRIGGD